MTMSNYFMTEKEQQFLTVASVDKNEWHNWGNGLDPAYVYFDFKDLVKSGIEVKLLFLQDKLSRFVKCSMPSILFKPKPSKFKSVINDASSVLITPLTTILG